MKAVCIHHDIDFPYTHDLADLLTLVDEQGLNIPSAVRKAALLTDYAVFTRYPGLAEPVTEEKYEEAVALAERVVKWVEGVIEP